MPVPLVAAATTVIAALTAFTWTALTTGSTYVLPGACGRVEFLLHKEIVGQDLAVGLLVDAVCTHLSRVEKGHSGRPLVLSAHGPPGVGKTLSHTLLARALYNKYPYQAVRCPGDDCQGAKVLYGLDFPAESRAQQLAAVRDALLAHVNSTRDPLVVIEEYDKLDCDSRAMLRQVLEHAHEADGSGGLSRAIVLLESNLGFTQLEQLLSEAGGDRRKISIEAAERVLKDTLFMAWHSRHGGSSQEEAPPTEVPLAEAAGQGCGETWTDTLRFTSLISGYLPFLPLQRQHVQEVMLRALQERAVSLWHEKQVNLTWRPDVVEWLTSKIDFDGPYPLEGASQVANVADRYLARPLRKCPTAKELKQSAKQQTAGGQEGASCALALQLSVQDGKLVAVYPTWGPQCR